MLLANENKFWTEYEFENILKLSILIFTIL